MKRLRAVALAVFLTFSAAFLATGPSYASSSGNPVTNQQFCLSTGQHLCMAALHPGLNSRMVLRRVANNRLEDIGYSFGVLRFLKLHNVCVGPNARTMHCSRPGTGWQGVTTHDAASKFWNIQDTVHDPHRLAHWLTASVPARGRQIIVTTNWHLQHVWWTCEDHCG